MARDLKFSLPFKGSTKWVNAINHWFSKFGPRPAASVTPRNLLEIQIFGSHPELLNHLLQGVIAGGTSNLSFNKPTHRCRLTLKLGNLTPKELAAPACN